MTHHLYKVAEHRMQIDFADDLTDAERLLPSFSPFKSEEEGNVLFTMTVARGEAPDFTALEEIGQFDCGGANHGVYLRPDGGYAFEISLPEVNGGQLSCCMEANADFTACHATLTGDTDMQHQFGLNNAIMMAFAFAAAEQDTVLMHASVIRNAGWGYLFTAPSGTGKSTHTHLWYKHIPGSDLMNDDNPVVRITDGTVRIYGSPWSGKTPCYRNISAPVGAIVRIEQRPVNEIERLKPIPAFATLLPAVSSMKWDRRVYNGICDCLSKLLATTPVFLLGCRPDAEAAHVSYDAIHRA
ncbi:MAG: hypothetical protein IJS59_07570 [Bacteroidaceae bacterium]|nr:hypothetical protein [Bacteroidaceae bacterium]